MKKGIEILLIFIFCFGGFLLICYPFVSDHFHSIGQKNVIEDYVKKVNDLDQKTYENILKDANDYNEALIGMPTLSLSHPSSYNDFLNYFDDVFAYIEIPKINALLPIYHGIDDEVLQIGIGHVPGSSFPTGEVGSHAVLLGHSGLSSSKLFTYLNKLEVGDTFSITFLNEHTVYKVDDIKVVLPDELKSIKVEEGETYVTLVTCTPYAINTHRLLVRGQKVNATST